MKGQDIRPRKRVRNHYNFFTHVNPTDIIELMRKIIQFMQAINLM